MLTITRREWSLGLQFMKGSGAIPERHFSVFQHHPGARFIPWGTDLELFYPKPHESSDDLIFFHSAGMGGNNLRKGTDLVVEAFQSVKGHTKLLIHSQIPVEFFGERVASLIDCDPRIEFLQGKMTRARSVLSRGCLCLSDSTRRDRPKYSGGNSLRPARYWNRCWPLQ